MLVDERSTGTAGVQVRKPIRRRRDRPERELPEVAGGAIRFCRKLGQRIGGQGDPHDLQLLLDLEQTVKDAQHVAVAGLRAQGHSDQTIGEAVGKYRQWVEYHFPRPKS